MIATHNRLIQPIKCAVKGVTAVRSISPTTIVRSNSSAHAGAKANGTVKPLKIWKPSKILAWQEPKDSHILLPKYLTKGSLTSLIGQGGLGKTRLALWLAVCQILGRDWCGLDTSGGPIKWLFLGDENSIARWKDDLTRMFSTLTPTEIARVDEFLALPALEEIDDCDIWFGEPENKKRIAATIKAEQPGVIVADPLGNFAEDDVSKPDAMTDVVRELLPILRKNAPNAADLIIHHARGGQKNILQCIGYDAANFALGGKALVRRTRCQLNLGPGSKDDDTRLVLACGKVNDCAKFQPRGLIYDPKTSTYSVDPDFDVGEWVDEFKSKGSKASDESKQLITDDEIAKLCIPPKIYHELAEAISKQIGRPATNCYRMIKRAVKNKKIETAVRDSVEKYVPVSGQLA